MTTLYKQKNIKLNCFPIAISLIKCPKGNPILAAQRKGATKLRCNREKSRILMAQGQILIITGIENTDLNGQFCVACSRVSLANNLCIHAPNRITENIVYQEIL